MRSLLPLVFFVGELALIFWSCGLWRARKITVISYAYISAANEFGYAHRPIRTRCAAITPEGQLVPHATDQGAFIVHVDDEGTTWCWGWEQEDVDALVVSYTLK